MNHTPTHTVRRFLRDCAEGRKNAGAIPPALSKRAAKALRRMPATALLTEEDVVAELILALREGRWSAVDWETLTDADLERRLSVTLRRLVVESCDGWGERKGIREHVAGAMEAGLPPAGDLPHTLCDDDRFNGRRIAQAAAWFIARHPELADDAGAVTNQLRKAYGLHIEALAPANDDGEVWEPADASDPYAQIEAALDAEGFVRALSETLSNREAFVLRGRLGGRGLQSLADELGCAVSTAFNLEKKAAAKVAGLVHGRGADADTVALALDLVLRSECVVT